MIVHHGRMVERSAVRRGWVSVWVLLSMTAMLAALSLAVNAAWFSTARIELQAAADSAALAGAGQLVSDEWLRLGQPGVAALLQNAAGAAQTYAGLNQALGQGVVLRIDPTQTGGDFALGVIGPGGVFTPADLSNPTSLSIDQVSAAIVFARRLQSRGMGVPVLLGALALMPAMDLQAVAVARLHRDVVGFQAAPGQSIPIVPIAVLSDPTGATPTSWENQIILRNGPDTFGFDPVLGVVPVPGGDGIPEIDLVIPLASGNSAVGNVFLLSIGSTPLADQVAGGVSCADLIAQFGPPPSVVAQLLMDANNQILAPGGVTGPAMNTPDYTQLVAALNGLQQQGLGRVWPLASGIDPVSGNAIVNAFVAARVVQVVETPGGPLTVRLQPTMLGAPQAITDASREGAVYLTPNPYLAKARLVR